MAPKKTVAKRTPAKRARSSASRGASSSRGSRGSKRVRFSEASGEEPTPTPIRKQSKWEKSKTMTPQDKWKPIEYFGSTSKRAFFYEKFFDQRHISEERVIDFDFLKKFNFPVIEWIKYQGWYDLMKVRRPIYNFLVQIFYSNFIRLTSYVAGREIPFGGNDFEAVESLGNILDIPIIDESVPDDVSSGDMFNFLSRSTNYNDTTVSVKTKSLPVEYQVLRHILSYIILPKYGSRDIITRQEVDIMWRIVKFKKVSLPKIMIKHMGHCSGNRLNMTLPYGVFLTLIFEYFDIDLEFETPSAIPKTHVIGQNQLSKMGFKEKDLVGLFGREARSKAREDRPLESSSSEEEEEDGDEDSDEDGDGAADDFHIHVRGDEATSRGDVPGPSRPVPDVGEATATSSSFQTALDQLQANIFFRLDSMETHWNFQFQTLNTKIELLSSDVHRLIHTPTPPPPSPFDMDPPTSPPPPPPPLSHFHGIRLSHVLSLPSAPF